jgi:AP-1-like factor
MGRGGKRRSYGSVIKSRNIQRILCQESSETNIRTIQRMAPFPPLPNSKPSLLLLTRTRTQASRKRKRDPAEDLNLGARLAELERLNANVAKENELLKLQLQMAATENELLKARSSIPPKDFYTEVLRTHKNQTPSHRIMTSNTGERLLAPGAIWDYIITHPLYKRGLVNVGDVSERLKMVAKCDGQGPVSEGGRLISLSSRVLRKMMSYCN